MPNSCSQNGLKEVWKYVSCPLYESCVGVSGTPRRCSCKDSFDKSKRREPAAWTVYDSGGRLSGLVFAHTSHRPRAGSPNSAEGRLRSGILTHGGREKQLFEAGTWPVQGAVAGGGSGIRAPNGGRSADGPASPSADSPALFRDAQSSPTRRNMYVLTFDGPSETVSPCVST